MSTLQSRYAALPRAVRWALWGGAVIGGYFLVVEPILNKTDDYRALGDQLARELDEQAKLRASVSGAARTVEQTAAVFGRPTSPAAMSEQAGALERRVNAVFSTHKVNNQRASYRDPAVLTATPPGSLAGPNQRLERLAVELSFECDLPTLLAVLTDLEQASEVAAISRLNVRKSQPGGRGRNTSSLIVNLAAEGWQVGAAATGSRSGRPANGGEP